jgi:hypothetical protein
LNPWRMFNKMADNSSSLNTNLDTNGMDIEDEDVGIGTLLGLASENVPISPFKTNVNTHSNESTPQLAYNRPPSSNLMRHSSELLSFFDFFFFFF